MPWKEVSVEHLAKSLGISPGEVREKQKLMELIVAERKRRGMSQVALAAKLGVTQARIAQIESGVGSARVTFDLLLNILFGLGFDFRIVPKRLE